MEQKQETQDGHSKYKLTGIQGEKEEYFYTRQPVKDWFQCFLMRTGKTEETEETCGCQRQEDSSSKVSFTTLSSIAIQAGRTQIVASVLQVTEIQTFTVQLLSFNLYVETDELKYNKSGRKTFI